MTCKERDEGNEQKEIDIKKRRMEWIGRKEENEKETEEKKKKKRKWRN